MTLIEFASIADIVASLGVIASLVFVAWEIRKSTLQTALANWGSMVDRAVTVYSQMDSIELANLVVRGRQNYAALSEAEKLSFGHYHEQLCIALMGVLITAQANPHSRAENLTIFRRHMRFYLGFKGARAWFDEFESQRGFPADIMRAIHDAID